MRKSLRLLDYMIMVGRGCLVNHLFLERRAGRRQRDLSSSVPDVYGALLLFYLIYVYVCVVV